MCVVARVCSFVCRACLRVLVSDAQEIEDMGHMRSDKRVIVWNIFDFKGLLDKLQPGEKISSVPFNVRIP
jgi:hypothetical protein